MKILLTDKEIEQIEENTPIFHKIQRILLMTDRFKEQEEMQNAKQIELYEDYDLHNLALSSTQAVYDLIKIIFGDEIDHYKSIEEIAKEIVYGYHDAEMREIFISLLTLKKETFKKYKNGLEYLIKILKTGE